MKRYFYFLKVTCLDPSENTMIPDPTLRPFSNWPMYLAPSGKVICPWPWRWPSSDHSPKYSAPSGYLYLAAIVNLHGEKRRRRWRELVRWWKYRSTCINSQICKTSLCIRALGKYLEQCYIVFSVRSFLVFGQGLKWKVSQHLTISKQNPSKC